MWPYPTTEKIFLHSSSISFILFSSYRMGKHPNLSRHTQYFRHPWSKVTGTYVSKYYSLRRSYPQWRMHKFIYISKYYCKNLNNSKYRIRQRGPRIPIAHALCSLSAPPKKGSHAFCPPINDDLGVVT